MFILYTLMIVACLTPIIIKAFQQRRKVEPVDRPVRSFPWWGWLGLIIGILAWILAWTRFELQGKIG